MRYETATGVFSEQELKQLLHNLYWESVLPIPCISSKLAIPVATIEFWLTKFGIAAKLEITKDLLENMYYVQKLLKEDIAKKLRLSDRELNAQFRKHDISMRNRDAYLEILK